MTKFLDTPIEYLKGVGPVRGEALRTEASIKTFGDLLFDYPFRYVDRTTFQKIRGAKEGDTVQLVGQFISTEEARYKRSGRFSAIFQDESGWIEVIWFQSVKWVKANLKLHTPYLLYGKIGRYSSRLNIAHPELELFAEVSPEKLARLVPVYSTTEFLMTKGLDARGRRKLMEALISQFQPEHVPENLPLYLINKLRFMSRYDTLRAIHLPGDDVERQRAEDRLKFEEFFFSQLLLLAARNHRKLQIPGIPFVQVGEKFHQFYKEKLPFALTEAQKRVVKEIRQDVGSGHQMNRLLQGDVGSGKTIVALMCMLIAIDNGYQCCLMAPTEILAQQHYTAIHNYINDLHLRVAFLSGSVTGSERMSILRGLHNGSIHMIIGTHALLEDTVQYHKLGLAITDEQHRFGVEQRARLWAKTEGIPPHILVMTATPIPRTLAMTLYGDLDVSVIDELPPGRKPIVTSNRSEAHRPQVNTFMEKQIAEGRQVFVIFPLIEESEKLDLENLQAGYEKLRIRFPPPQYQISVVHGRMKTDDKDYEMQRFIQKKTQIMVATTVIEVGVDIPNATVMVIENAERFGLSQLHQLRGRVGRGGSQSYCILMHSYKLSKEAKERLQTMVKTNDGFEIAEADLRLRGPGDLTGTRQSGALDLRLASLTRDHKILTAARNIAQRILEDDPGLKKEINRPLLKYLSESSTLSKEWHRVG
ncbi:MAG TPA: ATP-dependent DNA helicase RecG [Saprospiraceae bacterium]|nr:ATP-dependent DNA helicase RecG [Saprospiraceae bacterium]